MRDSQRMRRRRTDDGQRPDADAGPVARDFGGDRGMLARVGQADRHGQRPRRVEARGGEQLSGEVEPRRRRLDRPVGQRRGRRARQRRHEAKDRGQRDAEQAAAKVVAVDRHRQRAADARIGERSGGMDQIAVHAPRRLDAQRIRRGKQPRVVEPGEAGADDDVGPVAREAGDRRTGIVDRGQHDPAKARRTGQSGRVADQHQRPCDGIDDAQGPERRRPRAGGDNRQIGLREQRQQPRHRAGRADFDDAVDRCVDAERGNRQRPAKDGVAVGQRGEQRPRRIAAARRGGPAEGGNDVGRGYRPAARPRPRSQSKNDAFPVAGDAPARRQCRHDVTVAVEADKADLRRAGDRAPDLAAARRRDEVDAQNRAGVAGAAAASGERQSRGDDGGEGGTDRHRRRPTAGAARRKAAILAADEVSLAPWQPSLACRSGGPWYASAMVVPAADVTALIGNTPLVTLRGPSAQTGCTILGKCEFMNPGGSVKDRAALFIIRDAEERGLLQPGGTIVEGTAGNTGIGLATVANALGYRTVIVMPDTQSREKQDTLRALGAKLVLVPAAPYSSPCHYVHQSRRIAAETPGAVWANQFDNLANRRAHIKTTAPEIWADTGGRIDGFTCAVGTGGTLAGVAIGLKTFKPEVVIALSDPDGAALFDWFAHGELKSSGSSVSEGIGQSRITANLDGLTVDTQFRISDAEALPLVHSLLADEGLCLGLSSGINVAGAIRLAEHLGPGTTIVTILCDSGMRYLSTLFNPAWCAAKGLPAPPWLDASTSASPSIM